MSRTSSKSQGSYMDIFEKSIIPTISGTIEGRKNARECLNEFEKRISSINEEILNLNKEIDEARKAATTAQDHQESVRTIIGLKNHIKVLQEIKDEIERNTLPDCKMKLEEAETAIQQAAIVELEKIMKQEREDIVNILLNARQRVNAFEKAKEALTDKLQLPLGKSLEREAELYIGGLREIDPDLHSTF